MEDSLSWTIGLSDTSGRHGGFWRLELEIIRPLNMLALIVCRHVAIIVLMRPFLIVAATSREATNRPNDFDALEKSIDCVSRDCRTIVDDRRSLQPTTTICER